jgi:hypothetical protein
MTIPKQHPTPFGWKVKELMFDRGVEKVEDLNLSAESEEALFEHIRGEGIELPSGAVPEIADALGVDWRNHSREAREMANAGCWYLFMHSRHMEPAGSGANV